jgi:hypothetical protein
VQEAVLAEAALVRALVAMVAQVAQHQAEHIILLVPLAVLVEQVAVVAAEQRLLLVIHS